MVSEQNVILERRAVKQLRWLDPKTRARVSSALEELKEGFSARLDIKKLKGMNNRYRVRVGDYRILFEITSDKQFIVFDILPREKAYG